MNAERLHAVARTVLNDFEKLKLMTFLQTVESTLSTSVSQPTAPNAELFDQALKALGEALSMCNSNNFVPSQDCVLKAIGGADKTGVGLESQLRAILEEEKVTPASALSRIQTHRQEVNKFQKLLSQLTDSFETLNIGMDSMKEGEVELGVLMPRELVANGVAGLSKELGLVDRYLKVFAEIVGGDVESFKIRSLSTSSLNVFLSSTPVVAAFVMAAVERLAALYKQILEIRLLRHQLEEKKVPKTVVDQLRKHEEEEVRTGVDEIGKELLKEFYQGKNSERKNELRNALVLALKFLADRIDKGVDIEATAAPPAEQPTDEAGTSSAASPERKAIDAILHSGRALRVLDRAPEPVLQLPEADRRQIEEDTKK